MANAKARVAVLISGQGSNMAALIYAAKAVDCPYEIACVISNNPSAPGLALAAAEGIPTFAHSHKGLSREGFDAIVDAELSRDNPDVIALAGYMRILSRAFVERWQGRMINIHPSLLPKYPGIDTYNRAIEAGDTVAGCSVHEVVADLDAGPVLGQIEVAVLPGDTAESLAERIRSAEHQLYPRILNEFVTRDHRPEAILDRIRAIALALPASQEKLSHGSPGFFVEGGKFFAYYSDNHHNSGVCGLLVKASGVDEQAMLIEQDPDLYYRPAYLGPSGWIGIRLDRGTNDWDHVAEWLSKSWALSAPAKLRKSIDLAADF
jgi:phosphoribosylglycinamide formyltransferase 1